MVRMPGHESSDLVTQRKRRTLAISLRRCGRTSPKMPRLLETIEARGRAHERAEILPKRLFLSETELVNTQQTLDCGSERGAGSDQR